VKISRFTAAAAAALGVIALALSAVFGVAAQAAPAHVRSFPAGTHLYYTYDKGYGVVVATSGVNASKTASFTIWADPYDGATFSPDSGNSAFGNYLMQIGEFVHGPGLTPANENGLTLIWSGKNAYTNNIETYVFKGPGNVNDGAAGRVKLLLTTGLPYPAP
jgi:hypothetical protein